MLPSFFCPYGANYPTDKDFLIFCEIIEIRDV